MYHSNKVLLVKTNMSGLYVNFLFTSQKAVVGYSWIRQINMPVGDGRCCISTVLSVIVNCLRG